MARRCVVLFARPPQQEARSKRIAPAAALFEHTWRRISDAVAALPDVDLLICTEGAAAPATQGAQSRILQRGASFGERLANAFRDAGRLGYSRIIAVGTDSPGLDARHLSAAFAFLETHDEVLGRAHDGGVYLIGVRGDPGHLFEGVPWNTARVCARLVANCRRGAILPDRLGDIDRLADLKALAHDPSLDPRTAALVRFLLARVPLPPALDSGVLLKRPQHAELLRGPPSFPPAIPSV